VSDEANLDAYLKRINYAGSIAPTLETLQMLHRQHPAVIAFETLDPLLERPVRLQLSDIEQKLLNERRGGYCFEHNLLFKAVLEAMDYTVTPLGAGVLWGRSADDTGEAALTHMAMTVEVGGTQYLADVGFGGQVMAGPLRLRADLEQTVGGETYRLTGGHPKWRLETRIGVDWRPMYEFTLAPQTLDDYVAMNDGTMVMFRDMLIAARTDGEVRYGLFNGRLNTHRNGETTTRMLDTVAEVREALTGTFLITLPDSDRLDPAIEKALRPEAAA
jgi:N-hydroxyarylamine O-acetyltransferase